MRHNDKSKLICSTFNQSISQSLWVPFHYVRVSTFSFSFRLIYLFDLSNCLSPFVSIGIGIGIVIDLFSLHKQILCLNCLSVCLSVSLALKYFVILPVYVHPVWKYYLMSSVLQQYIRLNTIRNYIETVCLSVCLTGFPSFYIFCLIFSFV